MNSRYTLLISGGLEMSAKDKAVKVIRSCRTMYQIPMARRFAKLAGFTSHEIEQFVAELGIY